MCGSVHLIRVACMSMGGGLYTGLWQHFWEKRRPSPSNHQQPIAPQHGVGPHESLSHPCWNIAESSQVQVTVAPVSSWVQWSCQALKTALQGTPPILQMVLTLSNLMGDLSGHPHHPVKIDSVSIVPLLQMKKLRLWEFEFSMGQSYMAVSLTCGTRYDLHRSSQNCTELNNRTQVSSWFMRNILFQI